MRIITGHWFAYWKCVDLWKYENVWIFSLAELNLMHCTENQNFLLPLLAQVNYLCWRYWESEDYPWFSFAKLIIMKRQSRILKWHGEFAAQATLTISAKKKMRIIGVQFKGFNFGIKNRHLSWFQHLQLLSICATRIMQYPKSAATQ